MPAQAGIRDGVPRTMDPRLRGGDGRECGDDGPTLLDRFWALGSATLGLCELGLATRGASFFNFTFDLGRNEKRPAAECGAFLR